VCSPADLEEYPISAPIPGHQPAWFRLSYVDVFLRSWTEANALIEDVRSDVRRLKSTLDIMDEITPQGIEAIGGAIICSSSSSSAALPPSSSSSSGSVGGPMSLTRWGTFEQSGGVGDVWDATGLGAGSPIGSSDSLSGSMPYSYSSVALLSHTVSQMLIIQGYDFDAVPDNSILDGIEARLLTRWRNGHSSASSLSSNDAGACGMGGEIVWSHAGGPQLFFFRLYHPDLGPVGDDKSNNVRIYGPDWQEMIFGSSSDLWNAGLTLDEIRQGGFGVSLVVGNLGEDPEYIVDVDGVELTLHYRIVY